MSSMQAQERLSCLLAGCTITSMLFPYGGRRVTPAVFGPQVYPGPFVCVLKDGLLSMTNGPPLLVCHWMGYTVICDNSPQSKSH